MAEGKVKIKVIKLFAQPGRLFEPGIEEVTEAEAKQFIGMGNAEAYEEPAAIEPQATEVPVAEAPAHQGTEAQATETVEAPPQAVDAPAAEAPASQAH